MSVLILIVMDNGLSQIVLLSVTVAESVLILIVMDNGLSHLRSWKLYPW